MAKTTKTSVAERQSNAGDHLDMRPALQVGVGPSGQSRVDFDRRHPAGVTDDFGKHGRIVAATRSNLQHPLTPGNIEVLEVAGPKARHPIVELPTRVDRDQDVVIEPPRIVVRGDERLPVGGDDPPRTSADESLSRDGAERLDNVWGRLDRRAA